MPLRITINTVDRVSLFALVALVVSYSLIVGDTRASSAGWAWLGVALILLVSNAARLNVDARPSERGVMVGVATLLLGILRITGVVPEVTLEIAAVTVILPLLLPWVARRARSGFIRFSQIRSGKVAK